MSGLVGQVGNLPGQITNLPHDLAPSSFRLPPSLFCLYRLCGQFGVMVSLVAIPERKKAQEMASGLKMALG
jgi:hypothetical protein